MKNFVWMAESATKGIFEWLNLLIVKIIQEFCIYLPDNLPNYLPVFESKFMKDIGKSCVICHSSSNWILILTIRFGGSKCPRKVKLQGFGGDLQDERVDLAKCFFLAGYGASVEDRGRMASRDQIKGKQSKDSSRKLALVVERGERKGLQWHLMKVQDRLFNSRIKYIESLLWCMWLTIIMLIYHHRIFNPSSP